MAALQQLSKRAEDLEPSATLAIAAETPLAWSLIR